MAIPFVNPLYQQLLQFTFGTPIQILQSISFRSVGQLLCWEVVAKVEQRITEEVAIIAARSSEVQKQADEGDAWTLVGAGAGFLPMGCRSYVSLKLVLFSRYRMVEVYELRQHRLPNPLPYMFRGEDATLNAEGRTQFIETTESGSYKVADRSVVCILEELLALEILKFWANLNHDSYVKENATLWV